MALLDLTDDDLAVLNEGLCAMPFGQVAPLISKINLQLTAQREAVATKPDEALTPADDVSA